MYSCKQKEKMRKFIVLEIHFPIYLDALFIGNGFYFFL